MSAGEKVIAKEMRRQEKERRKRIEQANKMLIPVSKKTAMTLGMISFDPSQLSETNDGKQMSDNWIDKRLDDAVGKEKADEIRDAAEDNPDSVSHEVYHIDPNVDDNGNTHTDTQEVDSEGNKVGEKIIVEYFDKDGNRIDPSSEA
ncbi:hypothetical protein SAMN02745136_03311 [Anaerocolumna jejuensis DSM 15929]|uniref:Uncharacterized protein n=1 Tax=Anaerocolumna jejuensis DSM 15929 TaxID=1121322 RepID=A0A1M6V7K1_9FIRM|nr:hypothetical protein [Anaerocolumna jejuensis]SHK77428.1 hypothetical protein SAMN02745136_03311 [Anaerocolumna jejuensis DSM 15929]